MVFTGGITRVSADKHRGCNRVGYNFADGEEDELVSYTIQKPRHAPVRYFTHSNHLYSIAATTNAAGAVVERYSYNAYGVRMVKNSAGATLAKSAVNQDRGFTSYKLDSETGLYFARNRMYSASAGRFISRDQLGYVDGYSQYAGYSISNGLDSDGLRYRFEFDLTRVFTDISNHRILRSTVSQGVFCTACVNGSMPCWETFRYTYSKYNITHIRGEFMEYRINEWTEMFQDAVSIGNSATVGTAGSALTNALARGGAALNAAGLQLLVSGVGAGGVGVHNFSMLQTGLRAISAGRGLTVAARASGVASTAVIGLGLGTEGFQRFVGPNSNRIWTGSTIVNELGTQREDLPDETSDVNEKFRQLPCPTCPTVYGSGGSYA